MEEIQLDTGMVQYRINEGGVLFMNPADPGLYARLQEAIQPLEGLEKTLKEKCRDNPTDFFREADREIRRILQEVFGPPNDFTRILPGVNLLAMTGTGRRVIENLFAALEPILLKGAQACVQQQVASAVEKARSRRGE